MNSIAITGNITHDLELKTTPDGISVCTFTVAVKRPGTKDKTDFLNCVAWRQKAEFITRYFAKGQKIEITGIMTTRKWEDKNGNKRTAYEIMVNDAAFGEGKKKDDSSPDGNMIPDFECNDEDLPF